MITDNEDLELAFQRVYTDRINWCNSPNDSTPLSADNLNKGDYALQYHDKMLNDLFAIFQQLKPDFKDFRTFKDSIYEYIATYVNSRFDTTYNYIAYKSDTATFTFKKVNGDVVIADLYLEQLPIRFWFGTVPDHSEIGTVLWMEDSTGTRTYAPLGEILTDLANEAREYAEAARLSAEEAYDSAQSAKEDADRAELALSGSIIANFVIDENGHLKYTKIFNGYIDPSKDLDFKIKDNENLEVSFYV